MSPRSWIAVFALLFPIAARSEPGSLLDGLELSLDGAVGIPNGYVQVRENDRLGTRLRFHKDLGIDTVESATLDAAYHFDSDHALRLDFDAIFLYGSTRLDQDVFFNGARLQSGTTLESRPDFYRVTGLYEQRLLDLPGGGHLLGDVGATYVLLEYRLNGTLSPLSVGSERKEDFLTQELPVPMLGFSFEQPLAKRIDLVGSVLGGYLPKVDSLRSEGGTVYLGQSHADAALRLRYHLTPDLTLEGGYGFHYFTQRETSREDGNYFRMWNNDLTVRIGYRF